MGVNVQHLEGPNGKFPGRNNSLTNSEHAMVNQTSRREFTTYEKVLNECVHPNPNPHPCQQVEWRLQDRFEIDKLPHRICFALHEIQNPIDLLRSEMMTVTGVIIARMRRKQFRTTEVAPVRPPSTYIPFPT